MSSPMPEILLSQRFLPEIGGSITWMRELATRWPRPICVITHDYGSQNGVTKPVNLGNATVERLDLQMRNWGMDSGHSLLRYWRMCRAVRSKLDSGRLRTGATSTVYCTHAVPELLSLLILKKFRPRLRLVTFAHGEEILACASSRQLNWLQARAYQNCDLVIANCQNTATLVAKYCSEKKIAVVHPGVDVAQIATGAEHAAEWRKQLGIPGGEMVILSLGRLEPRKNHSTVLKALAGIHRGPTSLRYVIVGEGPCEHLLREEAQALGISSSVVFAGACDEQTKAAALHGCDIFIMPSISTPTDLEGFGMVFLEAGAAKKPSIAGASGGQPEAIVDGVTGLIADGNSIEAVRAALERLLDNPVLRQSLGNGAYAHVQKFDWPKLVQTTVEVIDSRLRKGAAE